MPFATYFRHADDVIEHMTSFIDGIDDLFLTSKYSGFVCIAAATVYEMSIKYILLDFARRRDKIFYNYLSTVFLKINARVKIEHLKNDYLKKFGNEYLKKFSDLLDFEDDYVFQNEKSSIKSSYDNILQWRHGFAHNGDAPLYATFLEIVRSYNIGKKVIECFYITLSY